MDYYSTTSTLCMSFLTVSAWETLGVLAKGTPTQDGDSGNSLMTS